MKRSAPAAEYRFFSFTFFVSGKASFGLAE